MGAIILKTSHLQKCFLAHLIPPLMRTLFLRDISHQINHAVGITPLVVIPEGYSLWGLLDHILISEHLLDQSFTTIWSVFDNFDLAEICYQFCQIRAVFQNSPELILFVTLSIS